jgi:hypothetical protein
MGAAVIDIRATPPTAMGMGDVTVARTTMEVTATAMRTVTAAEEARTEAIARQANSGGVRASRSVITLTAMHCPVRPRTVFPWC